MKRKLYVVTIVMVSILTFTILPALGQSDLPKYVRSASLAVGMTGYYVTVGIGSVMSKYSPIKVAVDPVGQHAAIFDLIRKKEAHMGAVGQEAIAAFRGEGIYEGKRLPILAGMTTTRMFNLIHTTKKTGITKIADLRGKRVLADLVPSPSTGKFTDIVLKAHGMTRNDIKWISFGSYAEGIAALIEGAADAMSHPSTLKGMQEIKRTVGYKAVPIEPGPAKKMLEMSFGYTYAVMPKGYGGVVEEDTPCLAYFTTLFFREDVPEEVVYTLVKAALDHHKEYARVHPLLPEVDAARAATVVGMAFHPGAIKYYKEKGVWTPEHEKRNAELLARFKR